MKFTLQKTVLDSYFKHKKEPVSELGLRLN